MYISLRESRANGFKKWSDSQQQKYSNQGGSNADDAAVTLAPDLGPAALTAPRPPTLTEGSL
jgi:hypothetical protein